jgi:hypothetical protein
MPSAKLDARVAVLENELTHVRPALDTLNSKVDGLVTVTGEIHVALARLAPSKKHPLAPSLKEILQLAILAGGLVGGVLWAKPKHNELKTVALEVAHEALSAEAK